MTSPWEESARRVITRGECELEPGVNFFVESLEKLGARPMFSCEGHPRGFYVFFKGSYDLACRIAKAGYFRVEVEVNQVHKRGSWSIRLSDHVVSMGDKEQVLSWASKAWADQLLGS